MIKVYFANIELLDEPELFSEGLECMHPMRQKKVLQCKQEIDKKRSLLAGILLKIALEAEGYVYEKLDFAIEEHGKPVIKNEDNLYFSLSHAGVYALCCISNQPVGVDLEVCAKSIFMAEKRDRLHAVARKMLSRAEYERFEQADTRQQVQLFLKYWTCKESYSKALGEGLRMKFSDIDTEQMGEVFWSEWLEEDVFLSVYAQPGSESKKELYKILGLKIQEGNVIKYV